MPTLAELKTRIIAETNRDDMGAGGELEARLADAIARAIEFHADETFWFNRASGTRTTVAGTATIALPAGMRIARAVALDQQPLARVGLETIEHLSAAGRPAAWAEEDGAIRLSPVPDQAYALSLYGLADLGVPATSNEWTNEGCDLVCARARLILYRDILRDPEGAGLAAQAEEEALARLRRETRRRGVTRLVADLPLPAAFDIRAGP